MKTVCSKTKHSDSIRLRKEKLGGSLARRLLPLGAAFSLIALGASITNAQNVLYNGDLDTLGAPGANGQANPGPDGWNIVAVETLNGIFNDGADSETWCNSTFDPQTSGYGIFFKPFQGTTNSNPSLDNTISVWFYQDNPSIAGTKYTLSAYACGQANYSGYNTTISNNGLYPQTGLYIEFLDASGNGLQTNNYDLIAAGLSNAGDPVPITQFTTLQYTAPAGTVTVRAGAYMLNVWDTTGAQSLLMDDFDLEATAPPGSPVITNEPAGATVGLGGTATFTVGVSNPSGATYAWYFKGSSTALSDSAGHISGSSTKTLTISGVSTNDVGHYQAIVSNGSGQARSSNVPLALTGLGLDPAITITGNVGDTYEVDYTTSLTPPVTWTPLPGFSPFVLTASPQTVIDTSGLGSQRYYRAVFLH